MAKRSTSKKVPARKGRDGLVKAGAMPAALVEMRKRFVVWEANNHLAVYVEDGNPVHILRAIQVAADTGEPLPLVMRRWLARAIAEFSDPPKRNGRPPPRNAARDMRIIRRLVAMHSGQLPKRVSDAAIDATAQAEGLTPAAVRMIVSRYRQRIGKLSRIDNRR